MDLTGAVQKSKRIRMDGTCVENEWARARVEFNGLEFEWSLNGIQGVQLYPSAFAWMACRALVEFNGLSLSEVNGVEPEWHLLASSLSGVNGFEPEEILSAMQWHRACVDLMGSAAQWA